ncbi:MAG: Glu-tRNA(Gln) amidotransferase subunit GatD [DPANN group archaeon]|nr:Glu-tRNA(Gln) amidotransferase subunit GatD [DPANN group archaeon]
MKVGDRVQVQSKDGVHEGIVLPSPENQKNLLMLKLVSGYNIGIKLDKSVKIKVLGARTKLEKFPTVQQKENKSLPNISLIATGGTIGSRVDYKTGAVQTLMKPEEFIANVPELAGIVNLKKISRPFAVWSENMSHVEWQKIAVEVAKELNAGAEGVIVTHGTDTLHYTAAALSFMLKNLGKPVALVGGQRSSDRGSFDGALNLICAANYCKSEIAEVSLIMHGEDADTYCLAMRGTKVRKLHTSRRDAFRPVNELPFAKIWKDKFELVNANYKRRTSNEERVTADVKFEPRVALVKFFPGQSPEIIDYYLSKKYRGLVIEASGLGHVPVDTKDKKLGWLPKIKKAIDSGILVCFAPQTLYGGLNQFVYAPARQLHDAGVLYLGDMLPETALVKLGWVLAHSKKLVVAKQLMLANLVGELNPRIPEEAFLY